MKRKIDDAIARLLPGEPCRETVIITDAGDRVVVAVYDNRDGDVVVALHAGTTSVNGTIGLAPMQLQPARVDLESLRAIVRVLTYARRRVDDSLRERK